MCACINVRLCVSLNIKKVSDKKCQKPFYKNKSNGEFSFEFLFSFLSSSECSECFSQPCGSIFLASLHVRCPFFIRFQCFVKCAIISMMKIKGTFMEWKTTQKKISSIANQESIVQKMLLFLVEIWVRQQFQRLHHVKYICIHIWLNKLTVLYWINYPDRMAMSVKRTCLSAVVFRSFWCLVHKLQFNAVEIDDCVSSFFFCIFHLYITLCDDRFSVFSANTL